MTLPSATSRGGAANAREGEEAATRPPRVSAEPVAAEALRKSRRLGQVMGGLQGDRAEG